MDDILHSIIMLIKEFSNKKEKPIKAQYQIGYDTRENAVKQIAADVLGEFYSNLSIHLRKEILIF